MSTEHRETASDRERTYLLKILGWSTGIIGTLLTVICMLVCGQLREMATDLKALAQAVNEHDKAIEALQDKATIFSADMIMAKSDIKDLAMLVYDAPPVRGTKQEEIRMPDRHGPRH